MNFNPGDVIRFPLKQIGKQGVVQSRPAIVLQSFENKKVVLVMKVTHSGEHKYFQRIPIERCARAGLEENSYAQIDNTQLLPHSVAGRPLGVLHKND